ncbi:Alpha-amylase 1 [Orchesella cincta]|uniref:alpha-amylase n=1 Tax=Orchesella cincta TaxID=48709 RepID=A0A1D2N0U8_ORCCI|nr:Alpha-amylase 1 [Orchesella cincta]
MAHIACANENAVIESHLAVVGRYHQFYQLKTRSGTEEEFASMVRRCNAVNVRVFVDVVLNHMTDNNRVGVGTGGNAYNAPEKSYPEYSAADFNARSKCPTSSGSIENWSDPTQIRNCEMLILRDLDQSQTYVREHIAEFLNRMIGYGVAGFRIDAVKMMWPADLKAIFDSLDNLPTQYGFAAGSRAFIYSETVDLGPTSQEPIPGSEYFGLGRTTEFRVGLNLGEGFRKGSYPLKNLVNWGPEWDMYPENYAVVFIDNHDNQRGHGGGGDYIHSLLGRIRPTKWRIRF